MSLTTRFANPSNFLRLAETLIPFALLASLVFFALGLFFALFNSPPDYQQGETVRIMYIHVPAAWIGMGLYLTMAIAAATALVARHVLADLFCVAAAPIGATFVAICLVTGSLWGAPTWGTWWVWDARLTSVLILFLLYCGYMTLRHSFDDDERGSKASAILLLVGVVNIPIIKFSVDWWNTLHQPSSLFRKGGVAIDPHMLCPLLLMAAAYGFYTAFLILVRMKTLLLSRKIDRLRDREP
jgi:heme exporter protein C